MRSIAFVPRPIVSLLLAAAQPPACCQPLLDLPKHAAQGCLVSELPEPGLQVLYLGTFCSGCAGSAALPGTGWSLSPWSLPA